MWRKLADNETKSVNIESLIRQQCELSKHMIKLQLLT